MVQSKLRLIAQPEENPMQRVQQLQDEARLIAMTQVREFEVALARLAAQARTLADAGEAIPPGVREICRSFAEDAEIRANSLGAITSRLVQPGAGRRVAPLRAG